jgi:hypothetical protein
MTSKKATIIVILVGAALLAFLMMPYFKGGAHTVEAPATEATSGPTLLWTFKSGTVTTIALGPGGQIYIGAVNAIYSVSPDGKQAWKQTMAGQLSLATTIDGYIYLASSHGFVYGVTSAGKPDWNPQAGLYGLDGPPAIGADGTVLYATVVSDLYAFRPTAGNQAIWSQSTFRPGIISTNAAMPGTARTSTARSKNSPAIWRDETVILPRQHWLHLFNPDGAPQWYTELTTGELGQVALDDDGVIYVTDGSTLFAVRHSGDLKWQLPLKEGMPGSPVLGIDGTIYVTTYSGVHAVNPDGTVKWDAKAPEPVTTGATLAADGTIYAGGQDGIFGMRPDGSVKFKLHGMSATGPLTISADGNIYYACGYMWVCAARDEGSPLMHSAWPKVFHDAANTSRILTAF